jgi:hypothetical protein
MDPCSKDEFEEDGGGDFGERVLRVCWTGWCSRLTVGRLGKASGFSMMCICARPGQWALSMVTPFISLVGIASVAKMVASDI